MLSQKKYKKLAIISDCIHSYDDNGIPCTEVHIFCKQMKELAKHFEQTVIVCPFVEYNAGKAHSQYHEHSISFISTPAVGGNSITHKLKLLATMPAWLKAFYKAGKISDVVYLRFPNNISIPAWFYYTIIGKKRFITYTNNWKGYSTEPITFRFQRWIIKFLHTDPAFVYTQLKNTRPQIFKTISPSYSLSEWEGEEKFVQDKLNVLKDRKKFIPIFLSVARLTKIKNHIHILKAFKILRDKKMNFCLYIIGDGKEDNNLKTFVADNNLQEYIIIKSSVLHQELKEYFRKAHFIVQSPLVEGYGKVPIEGFFHGCIPLLSNTGVSEEITGYGERGFVFSTKDINELVNLIEYSYKNYPQFANLILNGRKYAASVTLENWSAQIIEILNSSNGIK